MSDVAVRPETAAPEPDEVLDLVLRLAHELAAAGVRYCHWKSNEALDRSLRGDNDLDLLVRRADAPRFLAVLHGLGFRRGRPAPDRDVPGVLHAYGLDEPSGRIVHVHAQFQLVLGDDTTKNVRLPIEDRYLASADGDGLLPTPAAELEYVVLVVRMTLKHCPTDALVSRRGRLTPSERRELADLERRSDPAEVDRVLRTLLPSVDPALFAACRRALEPRSSLGERRQAGGRLVSALRDHTRTRPALDALRKLRRRGWWALQRRSGRDTASKRLDTGGLLVAVVGGDGAGKSSAVDILVRHLSDDIATARVHLGKPDVSVARRAVRAWVLTGRRVGLFRSVALPPWAELGPDFPGYAYLLWHLAIARDRRRAWTSARRAAAAGAVAVCDRYPLPELRLMDAPRTQAVAGLAHRPLAHWLVRREAACYRAIGRPDLLIVLRADPDIAVARSDDEPEAVRLRTGELWQQDWTAVPAVVIDADKPVPEVQRAVRRAVWELL